MTEAGNNAATLQGKATVYEIEPSRWRVQDIPARLRPREEAARVGIRNVGDDVVLALVLRSGIKGTNVVDLAYGLLRHYGSLAALAEAPAEELARVKGLGPVKAQILKAALDIGRRLNEECVPERQFVRTPSDAMLLLRDQARTLEKEIFWVLNLDAKNRLKGRPQEVTLGLVDASLVHPREVFREAIRSATAAVVVAHNHPSGDPTPSAEDVRITKQLVEAGRVVDIKVLDHVIIGRAPATGGRAFYSMREEGMVQF